MQHRHTSHTCSECNSVFISYQSLLIHCTQYGHSIHYNPDYKPEKVHLPTESIMGIGLLRQPSDFVINDLNNTNNDLNNYNYTVNNSSSSYVPPPPPSPPSSTLDLDTNDPSPLDSIIPYISITRKKSLAGSIKDIVGIIERDMTYQKIIDTDFNFLKNPNIRKARRKIHSFQKPKAKPTAKASPPCPAPSSSSSSSSYTYDNGPYSKTDKYYTSIRRNNSSSLNLMVPLSLPNKTTKKRKRKLAPLVNPKPLPIDLNDSNDFNKKVHAYELNYDANVNQDDYCITPSTATKKCRFCNGNRKYTTYMTTKQHYHPHRWAKSNPKRGFQLKYNKFKKFMRRACDPREAALHMMVQFVQSRAGYLHGKTGEDNLMCTVEQALRAKESLIGYGYKVHEYTAWCRTWPIKTAANPGMIGRGMKGIHGGTRRNEEHDNQVVEWVQEFFNLGTRNTNQHIHKRIKTKKRENKHKESVEAKIFNNLPLALSRLYSKVENQLDFSISTKHYESTAPNKSTTTTDTTTTDTKTTVTDIPLEGVQKNNEYLLDVTHYPPDTHADYIELQLADFYRQLGDYDKARKKTMILLSVLGTGNSTTTSSVKDLIDVGRRQLANIVSENSKIIMDRIETNRKIAKAEGMPLPSSEYDGDYYEYNLKDREEVLNSELKEQFRRVLISLESYGRLKKVRRYAQYQLTEFEYIQKFHEELSSEELNEKNISYIKELHTILDEYVIEMKVLEDTPTESEYYNVATAKGPSNFWIINDKIKSEADSNKSAKSSKSSKSRKSSSTLTSTSTTLTASSSSSSSSNGGGGDSSSSSSSSSSLVQPPVVLNSNGVQLHPSFGSECDEHRIECEACIIKWELRLNIMTGVQGITRYESMLNHLNTWFGAMHTLTIHISCILANHIFYTLQMMKPKNKKVIVYENMNTKQLLKKALEHLNNASKNCINMHYCQKINLDMMLIRKYL